MGARGFSLPPTSPLFTPRPPPSLNRGEGSARPALLQAAARRPAGSSTSPPDNAPVLTAGAHAGAWREGLGVTRRESPPMMSHGGAALPRGGGRYLEGGWDAPRARGGRRSRKSGGFAGSPLPCPPPARAAVNPCHSVGCARLRAAMCVYIDNKPCDTAHFFFVVTRMIQSAPILD